MDRLRPGLLRRLDDAVHDQIALRGRRRADRDRLVGHLDMQAGRVRFGIDGDGADAEALCRPHDPDGDLAPVGDRSEEHTSELQSLMRISYAVFCLKKKKTTSKEH